MKKISFICVSDFISSGSSAVIDYLKEFKYTFECKAEIRIIKDPYGIAELEQSLVHHWDFFNSAQAITDFLWLCNKYSRTKHKNIFSRAGLSYAKNINKNFKTLTNDYILSLSDYTYSSDFYYQKIKKSYPKYVIDRIRYGIEVFSKGKIKTRFRKNKTTYFAHPTSEKFIAETRKYLIKLFENCVSDDIENGYILLDQAISTNDIDAINRYFENGKLIIVDRDPRDMYVEDIEVWNENLDDDVISSEAGRKYVLRHKALREHLFNSNNVLMIKFEDLIMNYDNVANKIREFVGFEEINHVNPLKYLNPAISKKNIGIWKKYYNKYKDAIDTIEALLPEYCFNEEK